ncbi:uncharacterized protein LOC106151273 [Lingula anatina]|uniref:Uncharacterized protein LOC106151273 n=1 Tax=Lingula anatina TaxID=7574 RepID=A0A1S3H1K7_LINAN|nr:uncharacterized protein LOC106151273 [Lingula anatina]|eukprot:XP_013379903.1 uncharacterized protein LOC106151273 [Lingula anatina]
MLSGIKKRKAPHPAVAEARKQSNTNDNSASMKELGSASTSNMSETLDSFDNEVAFFSDLHTGRNGVPQSPRASSVYGQYHLNLDIDDAIPQTVSPRTRNVLSKNTFASPQHHGNNVKLFDSGPFNDVRILKDAHKHKHGHSVNFLKERVTPDQEIKDINADDSEMSCKQCQGVQLDTKARQLQNDLPVSAYVEHNGKHLPRHVPYGSHGQHPTCRQAHEGHYVGTKQMISSPITPTHSHIHVPDSQTLTMDNGHPFPGLLTNARTDQPVLDSWEVKPVHAWTFTDVTQWCSASEFSQFTQLFEGCGVDGKILIQITIEDLVELGVSDPTLGQKFLHAIQKLVEEHPNNSWGTTEGKNKWQFSLNENLLLSDAQKSQPTTKKNLEGNSGSKMPLFGAGRRVVLGRKRSNSAENLSFENERRAREQRRKSAGDVLTSDAKLLAPLPLWTNGDVLKWMDSVGLQKFRAVFKAKNITGKEITEINADYLETLSIRSSVDREMVLSKLQKLQQGARSLSFDNLQEAYLAEEQIEGAAVDKKSSVTFLAPTVAPSVFKRKTAKMPGERRKKGGFSWLKEAISPLRFGHKQKEFDVIQLWHDITNSGAPAAVAMRVHEAAPSVDIVRRFLEQNDTTDDPNLFCIVEMKNGEESELGRYECPLAVQRQWSVGMPHRFELKQRTGKPIKVICKITGLKPKGKTINVSNMSTCAEVLIVALNKYNMRHVDPGLFCLLEIDKDTGDVQLVGETDIIAELNTDSFIVCDKANMGMQIHCGAPPSTYTSSSGGVSRNESMLSKSSGKSFASGESSLVSSSSENNMKSKLEMEKLQSLEEEMAHIEASIDDYSIENKKGLREVKNISITSENLELFQEIELMKSSLEERDGLIQALKEENAKLKQQQHRQEPSLYKFLSRIDRYQVMDTKITCSLSDLQLVDSMAGGEGDGCLVVTNACGSLEEGDIILEIGGRKALGITEGSINHLAKTNDNLSKELVFLRMLDGQTDQDMVTKDAGILTSVDGSPQQLDLTAEVERLRERERYLVGECCSLQERVQCLQREVQLQKLSTDTLVAKFV